MKIFWYKSRWTTRVSLVFIAVGLLFVVGILFTGGFNDWSFTINTDKADAFGSLVGGIVGALFSLAGIMLVYETITLQQESFNLQQFESKFFEMLKIHRENVQSMRYTLPNKKNKEVVEGEAVFVRLVKELKIIHRKVRKKFPEAEIIDQIEMSTLFLFHGVGKNSIETLNNLFSSNELDVNSLINELRKRKTKYDNDIVYFGGHQNRLGHYYRHLYQSFKYINKTSFLSVEQKYNYGKLLRAQLSQYQIIMLFYNSLSRYGKAWRENDIIKDYKLFKHLPVILDTDIRPKDHYDDFEYDYEKMPPTMRHRQPG